MKKIILQFALLFLVIAALFLVAGRTEGWIEPPEEEATGDIILSGSKYNGKAVVSITLHPDGTGEHEGNGEKSPATWEAGEGDVAMVVHFNMRGTDYDMDVIDTGSGYSAMYPLVADFELTGAKPVKDIMLSGTKYSGKVVVNVTLHPDGTGEHEGNGDKTPATWEAGEGDVAMVVHFNVKGTDYDMNVIDDGVQYVADYPIIADFQLTGAKSSAAAAASSEPAEEAAEPSEQTAEPAEQAAEPTEESGKQEVAPAEAAPAESKDEEVSYPANTFVLPFTADISEQLKTTFFSESSVWGPAFGASGSYTPSESEDLLFSWSCAGKSNKLDFFANGTYEYQFTKMGIVEHGTWTFDGWRLILTSEGGKELPAELVKGEESAETAEPSEESGKQETAPAEAAPAESKQEEVSYPANTFVLPFTADISEQLKTTFFSESSVWGPALGASGSYTPSESEDLLFSWSCGGKSNKLDFFANGTYEYQFTKMGIVEHGIWNFDGWKLSVTTEAGRVMDAEITK